MDNKTYSEIIELPENVRVSLQGRTVFFEGNKGKLEEKFENPNVLIEVKENKIILKSLKSSKKNKAVVKTYKAHIINAINGVENGFEYKLKICSGHFPMNVSLSNNEIVIKNFLGEKVPRKIQIIKGADVKIDGSIIKVTSIKKETAGQMAANIEQATRRPGFDKRIFQDGIYIIEKAGKKI